MLKTFRVAASALATIFLLAGASGIQAADDQDEQSATMHDGHEIVPGEVLVKYRDPTMAGEAALEMDADHDEGIGGMATRRVHSRRYDTATLLAILAKRTDVEYAEPNYIVHAVLAATARPNDIYFNNPNLLWGLNNTGQSILGINGTSTADINATQAWAKTTGAPQYVVAVIDTGIDYNHPDLIKNIWKAPANFTVSFGGGTSITCTDPGTGIHGFNAISNSTTPCDPMDDNGHGTHASGTIGAIGNNNVGVTGINWTTSIMGVKFLDATGAGSISDAANAIEFAVQMKQLFISSGGKAGANIRVLSNSWGGGGPSNTLLTAIQDANTNDMLFVAAAGNSGSNNDQTAFYPANYNVANIVAVAATNNKDGLASFSNYGANTVALGAPGVNIVSTYPGNQYYYMSGTSMAAPHVSGVAALVLAACGNLSVANLTKTILNNAKPISSLSGKTSTGGRLDAGKSVTNCATTTPPTTPQLAITPPFSLAGGTVGVTYSATLTASGGTPPYSWSAFGLPAGLSINPATGEITGIPTTAGTSAVTVTVTDSATHKASSSVPTSIVIAPGSQSDLTINMTHSPSTFIRGKSGTYTIKVQNIGSLATSGRITMKDTLPVGLRASSLSGNGWSCSRSSATCTRNTILAAGASSAITLTVSVLSSAAPGTVTNTATVSGGGEVNTANDTASDPTAIK
jgi:subtilisin family serine protease